MQVLIVESGMELAGKWAQAMREDGLDCRIASDQAEAVETLHVDEYSVMLLDLALENGAALAVADYAAYRWPDMPVLVVSGGRAFADGSIFNHCVNVCAFMPKSTQPRDLAAMVRYHARSARMAAVA